MSQDFLISHLLQNGGKRSRSEIKFLCPNGHDKATPSAYYNIDKRSWYCHGCGKSGGEKSLFEAFGLEWTPDPTLPRNEKTDYSQRPPGIPEQLKDGKKISKWWTYRNDAGQIIGHVCRFETKVDGQVEKIVMPFFEFKGGKWKAKAPPVPRPLYGLELLASKPEEPIFVVEGEKCADALRRLGILAVTSQGGSKAYDKADWSVIRGRDVTIWPDNDKPGMDYAAGVKKILSQHNKVKTVDVSKLGGTVKGDDCVDWLARDPLAKKETVFSLPTLDRKVVVDFAWMEQLERDKQQNIKCTEVNLLKIFRYHDDFSGKVKWNARNLDIYIDGDLPTGFRCGQKWKDHNFSEVSEWLHDAMGIINPITSTVAASMLAVAQENEFDPVVEYLKSLTWDGVKRLESWLTYVTGCDGNLYTAAVGKSFLISAVARAMDPGSKVDTVLILHGPQGSLKSSLLAELAVRPEWFCDHVSDIGEKDSAMEISGPWIVEFSELDAISSKKDTERVKSWLTRRVDRFRPPYGRAVVDIPRRCVFSGTSNIEQFLRDETGGRRFWPVTISEIDLNFVREIRDQLWAEAYAAYTQGVKWWLDGETLEKALEEQNNRRIPDPWEDTIREWLIETHINVAKLHLDNRDTAGRRIYATSQEILNECLKVDIARQTKSDLDRCGRILGSVLSWTRSKRRTDMGVKSVWYPPKGHGEKTVLGFKKDETDVSVSGY